MIEKSWDSGKGGFFLQCTYWFIISGFKQWSYSFEHAQELKAQVFVTNYRCIQLWGKAILAKTCSHKSFNHHPRSSNAKFTVTNIYCHVNSSFINSPDFSIMCVNHDGLSCTLMYCACRAYPQEGHSLYIKFCNTWDEDECFGMLLWKNGTLNEYFIINKNSLKIFQISFHKWILGSLFTF